MLETSINKIWSIWTAGGWVMIPLLVLSLVIYTMAARLLLYFSRRAQRTVPDPTWKRWVQQPSEAHGEVGEIIRYTQDEVRSLQDVHNRFAEVVSAKLPPLDRRLTTLNVLVTTAPLLGLLGTVFGMLMTFRALSIGGGKITGLMAEGISQALFPPEVGLCVALPGMMLIYLIKRKRHEYEAFFARLESHTVQHLKKRFTRPVAPQRPVAPKPVRKARESLEPVNA